MRAVTALYRCTCPASYKLLLKVTLGNWKNDPGLDKFTNYFEKQWITSVYKKWQIFLTPAGFAQTNSQIESYNCRIKTDFTNRIKYHLHEALNVFKTLINYQSDNIKTIISEGKITKFIYTQAVAILKHSQLIQNGHKYNYNHYNNSIATIDSKNKTCSCDRFLDKSVCKHLTAACI